MQVGSEHAEVEATVGSAVGGTVGGGGCHAGRLGKRRAGGEPAAVGCARRQHERDHALHPAAPQREADRASDRRCREHPRRLAHLQHRQDSPLSFIFTHSARTVELHLHTLSAYH